MLDHVQEVTDGANDVANSANKPAVDRPRTHHLHHLTPWSCLCVLLTAYPFLDPGLNEKIFTDTAGSAMMDTPGKN